MTSPNDCIPFLVLPIFSELSGALPPAIAASLTFIFLGETHFDRDIKGDGKLLPSAFNSTEW